MSLKSKFHTKNCVKRSDIELILTCVTKRLRLEKYMQLANKVDSVSVKIFSSLPQNISPPIVSGSKFERCQFYSLCLYFPREGADVLETPHS